jgi:hypothetical protein
MDLDELLINICDFSRSTFEDQQDLEETLDQLREQSIRVADLLREGRNAKTVDKLGECLVELMGGARLKPVILRRISSGIIAYITASETSLAPR